MYGMLLTNDLRLKWRGVDLPRFTTVKMLGRIIKRPAVHIGYGPMTDNPPHLSLFYFPRAKHHGRESHRLTIWQRDFCQG
jgi:hypothetical protein